MQKKNNAARQYSLDLDEPVGHHGLLHASPIGTVLVWEQRVGGDHWHKIQPEDTQDEVRAFLAGLSGNADTYFSVNEFQGWRLQRLLKSLRACYVDVDLGRPADRLDLDAALDTLLEKGMPGPNLVIFSGRGLHLYWITKPTPASALPVWQAIERALVGALVGLGADIKAKDCTRVLRLAGTVNSKVGATVRGLVLDGVPWTFHHLADEVLGHRPEKPNKAPVRSLDAARVRQGHHPRATTFRRWHLVLADLRAIGKHHGRIPEGHRNEFLFLSSVALSWFAAPDSIQDEVVDMAEQYCPDIEASEAVLAASQSIARAKKAAGGEVHLWNGQEKDPRYYFKRLTLWERLAVLANPIKGRLRAIIPDDLAAEREVERQKNRDRVAEGRYADHYTGQGVRAGNEQKRVQARLLVAQGCSVSAIARELGVSRPTVDRWVAQGCTQSPL